MSSPHLECGAPAVPAGFLRPIEPMHSSAQSASTVVESQTYPGRGAAEDPYIVDWDQQDPENPRQWSMTRRWILTLQLSFATWNVSFASSSYSGGLEFTMDALHSSRTVAVLGISLYVLGFGVGPLLFAPLSEACHYNLYGRRIVFLWTCVPYFLFHLGGALATNIQTLVVCRFLAGVLGSSTISNAAGVISDLWAPRERGMATSLYSMCTFFGPVSGPIVGGFVSQSIPNGWRINFWIMFSLSGLVVIFAFLNLSETYAPVLLQRRARKLQAESGGNIHYTSAYEVKKKITKRQLILLNLKRPFIFLVTEPIVICLSVYISTVYATLYAQFTAYPIVFQKHRHFTPGECGLAFLGIFLGQCIGIASSPLQNRLYLHAMKMAGGKAPPEARLFGAMVGAVGLPLGIFWFAWTTFPSIHAIVPILAGAPFGLGMILIFTSLYAYIMDAYSLYTASALASTVFLRSVFAAAFPLFSSPMFERLGDQWACSVFAFLAVACMPMPLLFFKYGAWIRSRSTYAVKPPVPDADAASPSRPPEPKAGINE